MTEIWAIIDNFDEGKEIPFEVRSDHPCFNFDIREFFKWVMQSGGDIDNCYRVNGSRKLLIEGRTSEGEAYCADCDSKNKQHKITTKQGPLTDSNCWCGPGLPTNIHYCTSCGAESCGWVDANLVKGLV